MMAQPDIGPFLKRLPKITGLTADSRKVEPGFLFAALPGRTADGRDFIPEAVAKGALAVLAPTGTRLPAGLDGTPTLIADDEPRRRFAQVAAAFYGRQPETVAAVTGTNGKTSTAVFTQQLWDRLGVPAASLGTLGVISPTRSIDGAMTTPDPVILHALLKDLADDGTTHLAMEASSHGLDQYRLDGVTVSVAGFTNLSQDHLDYHGTMAAYLAAKARLFTEVLRPGGVAVINADTEQAAGLTAAAHRAGRRVNTYGRQGREVVLDALTPTETGLALEGWVFGREVRVTIPVVGTFQAHNALCALGMVLAARETVLPDDVDAAIDALARLRGVRGRLERVGRRANGAPVFVDYAHTPDALATVLGSLKPHVTGRLVVVFGAGGDRDRTKRPLMGQAVATFAHQAIVTDDNPRTEDPAAIRASVLTGCPDAMEIGDRAEAIRAGIALLRPGDVLVIAGKGHEPGQTIGHTVHPFDDATVARRMLFDLGEGEA